jgi:hypothetical protein
MRPNLSVEKIAGALAVLGAGVLMYACGGDKPANAPVNSTETPAAAGGDTATKAADSHCGAGKEHKPGEASCGGGAGDNSAAAPAAAPSTDSASASAASSATPAASASAAPADAKSGDAPKKGGKKPKKGGANGCGAGTCSAKK